MRHEPRADCRLYFRARPGRTEAISIGKRVGAGARTQPVLEAALKALTGLHVRVDTLAVAQIILPFAIVPVASGANVGLAERWVCRALGFRARAKDEVQGVATLSERKQKTRFKRPLETVRVAAR